MPFNFTEVEEALKNLEMHRRIWRKGYMFQKGGDTDVGIFNFT
jgi:hypothetical protein